MHHAGEALQQQPPPLPLSPFSPKTSSTALWPPVALTYLLVSTKALAPAAETLPQVSCHTAIMSPPTSAAQLVSPFVIWERRTHTHTHILLSSLWRGHRLFLSAHLPAAGWLCEPCLWWLRHVWGSGGLKQQASQTPRMANISASTLLHRERFMNHLSLSLIWDDKLLLIRPEIENIRRKVKKTNQSS